MIYSRKVFQRSNCIQKLLRRREFVYVSLAPGAYHFWSSSTLQSKNSTNDTPRAAWVFATLLSKQKMVPPGFNPFAQGALRTAKNCHSTALMIMRTMSDLVPVFKKSRIKGLSTTTSHTCIHTTSTPTPNLFKHSKYVAAVKNVRSTPTPSPPHTCSSMGMGLNWPCFKISVRRAPRSSTYWVAASRSEPNCAKAATSRNCASSSFRVPATCVRMCMCVWWACVRGAMCATHVLNDKKIQNMGFRVTATCVWMCMCLW